MSQMWIFMSDFLINELLHHPFISAARDKSVVCSGRETVTAGENGLYF